MPDNDFYATLLQAWIGTHSYIAQIYALIVLKRDVLLKLKALRVFYGDIFNIKSVLALGWFYCQG